MKGGRGRRARCAECNEPIVPALVVTFNGVKLHPVRCFDARLRSYRAGVEAQLRDLVARLDPSTLRVRGRR